MPRAKTGVVRRRRHKKILKQTKGYFLSRSKLYKSAHTAFIKAGEHAFKGRKLRKRDFKKLWIIRLNAALGQRGLKYSPFINSLRKSKIELDRKVLADIAGNYPKAFDKIVEKVSTNKK